MLQTVGIMPKMHDPLKKYLMPSFQAVLFDAASGHMHKTKAQTAEMAMVIIQKRSVFTADFCKPLPEKKDRKPKLL